MRIEHYSIKPRLVGAFGLIAALCLVVGWLGLRSTATSNAAVRQSDLARELLRHENEHLVWTQKLAAFRVNEGVSHLGVETDPGRCAFGEWYHGDGRRELEKAVPGAASVLARMEQPHRQLHESAAELQRLVAMGDSRRDRAVHLYESTTGVYLGQMRGLFAELGPIVEEHTTAMRSRAAAAAAAARRDLVLAMVISTLAALALGSLIASSIIRPVSALVGASEAISQGDLRLRIDSDAKDEIGVLTRAFGQMVNSLRDVVSSVSQASQTVFAAAQELTATADETGRASQQIAQTIEDVARGSADQSAAVGRSVKDIRELAKSLEDLSAGSRQQAAIVESAVLSLKDVMGAIALAAKSAESAAARSTEVAEVARGGAVSVERTVEGMGRIREATDAVARAIRQFGESSHQIGTIVQAIDDIAEQTNLLALNAAIEAARAGEHGRGFAVVADEVRKLAERSGTQTKEIALLIAQLQTVTLQAVEAMEAGSREVEAGTQLAAEAGESLERIKVAVDGVAKQVVEVSSATETINTSSADVGQAMETVAALTEETSAAAEAMAHSNRKVLEGTEEVASISAANAAAAEEVSAATEEQHASVEELSASSDEMARAAMRLRELVARFRLDDSEPEPVPTTFAKSDTPLRRAEDGRKAA